MHSDASFCGTGLERSGSLAADIKWFEETYKLAAPAVTPDGPGATYAALIADLAKTDPQAFICHYYNFYFAHTAGGRMIGNKVLICAWPSPDDKGERHDHLSRSSSMSHQ